jgi:uncharacterized cupin superfamily protein
VTRPPNIVHWSEIENRDPGNFQRTVEPMSMGAPLAEHLGLKTIGIHHMRLLPGRRTSLPHAESHEEEFVYVLTGTPDVWLDGVLHPLKPGDAVGFPPGTGQAHSFLNNTETEVTLLVVGNADIEANRIFYPVNLERKAWRQDWWQDAPQRDIGPHDGMTEARRAELARKSD